MTDSTIKIERGITRQPDGKYRARLSFKKKEHEQLFSTVESARNWRRSLLRDLERCPKDVRYTRSGWVATARNGIQVEEKTFSAMEDAAEWQLVTQRALDTGTFVDEQTAGLRLEDFVQSWRASKTRAGERTMMRYEVLLRNQVLPYLGERLFRDIRRKDIEQWVTQLSKDGHGIPSTTKALALVTQIFNYAIQTNVIATSNPTMNIVLPETKQSRKIALTPAQLEALAAECSPYSTLVMFLGLVGPRISEALILRVGDIDLSEPCVTIDKAWTIGHDYKQIEGTTKTNQVRTVPLPRVIVELLKPLIEGRNPHEFLFQGATGGPLNYGWFRKKYFAPAVQKLGLKNVTIHTLRHSFASILIQNKAVISNVSALMGHSSTQLTLKTYTHTYADGLKSDISKMDDIFSPQTGHERGSPKLLSA